MPISTLSAGALPAVAHSSSSEENQGALLYSSVWIPILSTRVGNYYMDISIKFYELEAPIQDRQENVVYIEYFHIKVFLFLYFCNGSVPWKIFFFQRISSNKFL